MLPTPDDARPDRLMDTAERRFRDLVHGVDAIVWEADAASLACTFVSQRAEELLGYPIERWLGATDFWGEIVDARDRERGLARYGEAPTAQRPLEHEIPDTTLILLPTEDREHLIVADAVGLDPGGDARVPMADSLSGRIATTRRALLVEDAARSDVDVPALWRARVRSLVGVPLSVDGHVV